jgi:hypothetical protein
MTWKAHICKSQSLKVIKGKVGTNYIWHCGYNKECKQDINNMLCFYLQ